MRYIALGSEQVSHTWRCLRYDEEPAEDEIEYSESRLLLAFPVASITLPCVPHSVHLPYRPVLTGTDWVYAVTGIAEVQCALP